MNFKFLEIFDIYNNYVYIGYLLIKVYNNFGKNIFELFNVRNLLFDLGWDKKD